MSGYDDLERQLRTSVRAKASAPDPAPRRPWWRRRPLILIALPAVLVAGVATAATQIGGGHSTGYQADRLVMQVMRDAGDAGDAGAVADGPCRRTDPGEEAPVIDAGAGPRIARVLPQLAAAPATPPTPDLIRMARRGAGEALLGRTVRTIAFPGGVQVLLFVSRGAGGGFADPPACAAAARRRLATHEATTSSPVYAAATRLLRRAFSSPAARESLHVGVGSEDTGWAVSAEARFPPARTLHTGVWVGFGGRGQDSRLAGIVRPDVALVRIVPARGTKTQVRRTAHPRDGAFVLTLPRKHGAMVVKQYDADGRYLRSDGLR